MKNFGRVLATTAVIAFAAVNAATETDTTINTTEEVKKEPDFFDMLQDDSFYARRVWLGLYQGFFGVSTRKAAVPKPSEKCFGPWITHEVKGLDKFATALTTDIWSVDFETSRKAAYSVIDLLFQNDEYCHFRDTAFTVYDFCGKPKHCEMDTILDNMSTNAFSLIT